MLQKCSCCGYTFFATESGDGACRTCDVRRTFEDNVVTKPILVAVSLAALADRKAK